MCISKKTRTRMNTRKNTRTNAFRAPKIFLHKILASSPPTEEHRITTAANNEQDIHILGRKNMIVNYYNNENHYVCFTFQAVD